MSLPDGGARHSPVEPRYGAMTLTDEVALTAALDAFYGEGGWDELEADEFAQAIFAAFEALGESDRGSDGDGGSE